MIAKSKAVCLSNSAPWTPVAWDFVPGVLMRQPECSDVPARNCGSRVEFE
jgi:hypothetical protein